MTEFWKVMLAESDKQFHIYIYVLANEDLRKSNIACILIPINLSLFQSSLIVRKSP